MHRLIPLLLALVVPAAAHGAEDDVQFRHPLDDTPAEIPLPDAEQRSEAVLTFHRTGENIYAGDPEAIAAGEEVYTTWCAPCHLPSGAGRIGPSFLDDYWRYPRADTAVGKFEIIYFGATGAMQSFADRLSQDEILQVIAHIDALREQAGAAPATAETPADPESRQD